MQCLRTQRCARRVLTVPLNLRRASAQETLREQLISRPPNIIYDYLSPTPSHLLNITLSDVLPPSCYPPNFNRSTQALPLARHNISRFTDSQILPQGHHLVYFSPPVPGNALLPDGTDPLQSPGPPYERRLWAGGSLLFNTYQEYQPELHSTRAACVERITDVTTKGLEGDEKVYVNIERRIGLVESAWDYNEREIDDEELLQRFLPKEEDEFGESSLIETRNIVFMRRKTESTAAADAFRIGKTLKRRQSQRCHKPILIYAPANMNPDFSVSIVPTQSLLFRFSALTFNAHAIHLDPDYGRKLEGHRHLLVHGPLSLVLMISVLRSQLNPGEIVRKLEYRNLAPLYAGEQLRVCVKRDSEREAKWDVWIQGSGGGYAVKGTAITGSLSS